MKKKIIIIMLLALMIGRLHAQDVSINIIAQEDEDGDGTWTNDGSWAVSSTTAIILVTLCNNDGGAVMVPQNKIRPLISVPSGLMEIKAVQPGLPAGWSIVSLNPTRTSIRLCNGADTWAPGECREFAIQVQPLITGGPGFVTATISWGNGSNCGNPSGPQTAGNDPSNDNSTTSATITPNASLPINLLSFEGSVSDCKTILKWKVSHDSNSELFEVEQSSDGQRFSSAGSVAATMGREAYELRTPHTGGKLYYRLKMKDQDGKTTYSQVIRVTSACGISADVFRVYPNPVVSSSFRIEFGKAGKYDVQLINAAGATVRHQQVQAAAGQVTEVNNVHYPAGMYVVKVTDTVNGITKYSKLVIKK